MRKTNKYILGFVYLFMILFLGLCGYLLYFNFKEAPTLAGSSNNGRLEKLNENIYRGSILSSDGEKLAYSKVDDDGNEVRVYPFDNIFSHVIGYTTVGEAGLEASAGYYLVNSHESVIKRFMEELQNGKSTGDTVVTTLDSDLQTLISEAMEGYQGACVVMDPKTGDIKAMVSKPDFDPNTIEDTYQELISDDSNSSLVNRATKGLYCPGSTFKIVTTLAYLEQTEQNEEDWQDYEYYCNGSIMEHGLTVNCSHGTAHGDVDLAASFAKSCNCSYINIGLKLSKSKFRKTAEKLMFNQELDLDFSASTSKFTLSGKSGNKTVMQTSFGQGDTLVTPLENAMIVSAVANGGTMMKPKLIKELQDAEGNTVQTFDDESYGSVMTAENASIIADFMEQTVDSGTATILQSSSYKACAKTGSAQTDTSKDTDAWLVAYAPADDPQLVVSIVLEEAGAGSTSAGPIVKKIFDSVLAK